MQAELSWGIKHTTNPKTQNQICLPNTASLTNARQNGSNETWERETGPPAIIFSLWWCFAKLFADQELWRGPFNAKPIDILQLLQYLKKYHETVQDI